jgi:hypothetical protein
VKGPQWIPREWREVSLLMLSACPAYKSSDLKQFPLASTSFIPRAEVQPEWRVKMSLLSAVTKSVNGQNSCASYQVLHLGELMENIVALSEQPRDLGLINKTWRKIVKYKVERRGGSIIRDWNQDTVRRMVPSEYAREGEPTLPQEMTRSVSYSLPSQPADPGSSYSSW